MVPDYANGWSFVGEAGDRSQRNYFPRDAWGKALVSYPNEKNWMMDGYDAAVNVGDFFTWIVPKPGFIRASANFDMAWYWRTDTSLLPNEISFWVGIRNSSSSIVSIFETRHSKTEKFYASSQYVPVAKGDVICWGVDYKGNGIPAEYSIIFYPAKAVDRKTGD